MEKDFLLSLTLTLTIWLLDGRHGSHMVGTAYEFATRRAVFGLLTCWLKSHVVLSEELVKSTAIIDHSSMLKRYMEVLIL